MRIRWVQIGVAGIIAILITTSAIYLTPLKWVNVIQPAMHEADPAQFEKSFAAHPDDYVFIDVRTPDLYAASHATGSINIPAKYLETSYKSLPRSGRKIALICGDGMLAAIAYGYLQYHGFTNLIHIQGGLANWVYEAQPTQGTHVTDHSAP